MKKLLSILLSVVVIAVIIPFGAMADELRPGEAKVIDSDNKLEVLDYDLNDQEWDVLKLINKERLKAGIDMISMADILLATSDERAADLLKLFSHTRPSGEEWNDFLGDFGVTGEFVGENIAAGYTSASAVMSYWMKTPEYAENILDSGYDHIGVGYNSGISKDKRTGQWVLNFVEGDCAEGEPILRYDNSVFPTGTTISELDMVVEIECSDFGSVYFPVIEEMCTGYNKNLSGTQTITVTCNDYYFEIPVILETPKTPFKDINMWAKESIEWVYEEGLFSGTGAATFSPNTEMKRGMLAMVLWRLAGKPSVSTSNGFTDVTASAYYFDAVRWASENEIVTGTGNGKFSPDRNISREQLAVMLYRYAKFKGEDVSTDTSVLNSFPDASKVSSYAKEEMSWAVNKGIITGKNGNLSPKGNASRAEVATMLMRYVGKA